MLICGWRSTEITAPRSPHQDHRTKITTPRSPHQDHRTIYQPLLNLFFSTSPAPSLRRPVVKLIGPRSISMVEDFDEHARQRSLIMPFFSPDAVATKMLGVQATVRAGGLFDRV